MKLYIRNMACESCKVLVKEELEKSGAEPLKVHLGEADIKGNLSEKKQEQFNAAIKKAGLELVKTKDGLLADHIKSAIADYINNIERKKVIYPITSAVSCTTIILTFLITFLLCRHALFNNTALV